MRRAVNCLLVLLFSVGIAAAEDRGKIVHESWDAAYLEGAKAGYVHTTVRAFEQNGRATYRTTVELDLSVKRFHDAISLRMESGTEESESGQLTGIFMTQHTGSNQQINLRGQVIDDEMQLTINGSTRAIPWDRKAIGLYAQEWLAKQRRIKPGDRFSYLTCEPTITALVTNRVKVEDYEDVLLPGSGKKQRLLKTVTTPDKIESIQLPALTAWLDKEYIPLRAQADMPGLGKLTLLRTDRQTALRRGAGGADVPDIGFDQHIPLRQRIPTPYETERAVYRITIKGDDDPASSFARDSRQQVKNVHGNTFELTVHAKAEPAPVEKPGKVKDEFLKNCHFITSDDSVVQEHARRAVGREMDPWRKALRIEQWVHTNMQTTNTEAFATASHVARHLQGDCTEYAVLTAAMCRAVGVPSRTAVGLLYIDGARGPAMGFHMWTEVWVRGQWMPIDATLGRGYVGATHLKITDHSWYDTKLLTPLFPVFRVLGKISIEILGADGRP